jgi:hypothetical protein
MALSCKHNRNARLGQSLFLAVRRLWPFFVARRRAKGAFFVRTPAWEPQGGPRAWRHAARTEPGVACGRHPGEPQPLPSLTSRTRRARQDGLPWRERGV